LSIARAKYLKLKVGGGGRCHSGVSPPFYRIMRANRDGEEFLLDIDREAELTVFFKKAMG
jgi:hypothetical protein